MINSFFGKHRFLSNFYPCQIIWNSVTYPTVEHAYQAAKTTDCSKRKQISQLKTPGQAKRAGNNLRLRLDWEEIRVDLMLELLHLKFTNPKLREMLIETGDIKLVEGNNWGDIFWGVYRGRGRNKLGNLLMQVRKAIS